MSHKQCPICKETKSFDSFSYCFNRKDKLTRICRACNNAKASDNYIKNEGKSITNIDPIAKACSTCAVIKEPIEFNKRKASPDGLCYNCRECDKIRKKAEYRKNPKAHYEKTKQYRIDNLEKVKAMDKKWREENKDRKSEVNKAWVAANKDRVAANKRRWESENPERIKVLRKRTKTKMRQDAVKRTRENLRNMTAHGLKRGGGFKWGSTASILGCSFEEAMTHLALTYELRYGEKYVDQEVEIDHCIPISYASTEEECYELSKITNLQFLKPEDNLRKSNNWSNAPYTERLTTL